MSITQTSVTGPVYLPNIQRPENARIVFELTSWDQEAGEAVFVSGPFVGDIDSNGDFSVNLFSNSNGVNATHYLVSVVYQNIYSEYKREHLGIVTLVGSGPFLLADLNIVSEWQANTFDVLADYAALSSRK